MRKRLINSLLILLCSTSAALAQQQAKQADDLAARLQPFVDCLNGADTEFALKAAGTIQVEGEAQPIHIEAKRVGDHAMSLSIEHPTYVLRIDRDQQMTQLFLPKHRTVIAGRGDEPDPRGDSLAPAGLMARLVSRDSAALAYVSILTVKDASMAATMLSTLAGLKPQGNGVWATAAGGEQLELRFADDNKTVELAMGESGLKIQLCELDEIKSSAEAVGTDVISQDVDRVEIERLLVRGVRRATEIAMPSGKLLAPYRQERQAPNGRMTWVEDQRLIVLSGTPQQIGESHGKLLAAEARKCMDSILYSVGIAKTVESGRWFLNDLRDAWKRLEKFIPDDHKAEMDAMAAAIGVSDEEMRLGNVFPELFHCSGFALWGSATVDGKLYHGRVLDYMTVIGLQDAAATFIIAPEGKNAFATVGYAGFIGSVSGMNDQQISLGEMGGRGEGKWDGVPMATLMRRALEECSTLDQVTRLWSDSPRTCEYYYVFADGKIPSAVGVAATPEKIEFFKPGAAHPLLGDGIADAVVLSAGDRLTTLRQRVTDYHGQIDADRALWLMSRPVSMRSNLHNVLFVPQDGVFYVTNADRQNPAAERPYVKYELNAILKDH